MSESSCFVFQVDLNLISLKQQVKVISLSKELSNNKQLEERTGINTLYVSYILEHQKEILKRWKEASATANPQNEEEKNDHSAIHCILQEWAKRSIWNGNKTIEPTEIEKKANELKTLYRTPKYNISCDFWEEFKAFKLQEAYNKNGSVVYSLDAEDILLSCKSQVQVATFEKFMNILLNHKNVTVPKVSANGTSANIPRRSLRSNQEKAKKNDESMESIAATERSALPLSQEQNSDENRTKRKNASLPTASSNCEY